MNDHTLDRIAHALERIATALERNNPKSISLSDGFSLLRISTEAPDQQVINPEPCSAPEPVQVAEPTVEPVTPAQPEEVKPSVTIDQIRKTVVTLSALGKEKKDAVREVITAYAAKVSEIPADKYTEVMDRLTALQEG